MDKDALIKHLEERSTELWHENESLKLQLFLLKCELDKRVCPKTKYLSDKCLTYRTTYLVFGQKALVGQSLIKQKVYKDSNTYYVIKDPLLKINL